MPDLCTFVTVRGPCEAVVLDGPYDTQPCGVEHGAHDRDGAHEWDGPVLTRCGHTLHCTMHHIGDYDGDCPGDHRTPKTEDDVHEFARGD